MYKIMLLDDEAEVRESILLQISKSSCCNLTEYLTKRTF